jgi:hypothetical protein
VPTTRWWFGLATDTSPVPNVPGPWTVTDTNLRLLSGTPRPASGSTAAASGSGSSAQSVRFVQYVSAPLAARTITGTARVMQSFSSNGVSAQVRPRIILRVVSGDGSTVRGTLLDWTGNLITTGGVQRWHLMDTALAAVAAQAGDRLVVDIGGQFSASRSVSLSQRAYTDPDATAADVDTANSRMTWLELVEPDPAGPPTDLAAVPGVDTADLSWTAPTTGGAVVGYEVRVNGGPPVAVGDVTAHTLTGLSPATDYTAEVRTLGDAGPSDWVPVAFTTLAGAAYRAVVRLGGRVWDVLAGTPPQLGPILPVSFGWAVPEDALGFPAQPDPDVCNLELVTADHADLAGVDIGTPMRVSLYTTASPTARPLATFRGRVADMEAAPHHLGLSWRLLGVGYDTDLGALQVGTAAWPQESGDARAARVVAEAGVTGWAAPAIGSTFEAREPAATTARAELLAVSDQAVSAEGTPYGPSRRVLVHPRTDANGDLTPSAPFGAAAVLRRTDALDVVAAGLVNRRTTWRRTKLLDATWVRIDHPGGPTTYGDTRGPAYPPQSVSVTDPRELADLVLDTTPGYRWLTGQPLRLELWADDGPALAVVSQWFYRDPDSPPFPWSGRAVLVRPIANSPDGSDTYAGMLTAATVRLEHDPARGGVLVVEFRLRPDIPAHSTVTMRWMDEPPAATWAEELAADPTGTWYDYYTTPRP